MQNYQEAGNNTYLYLYTKPHKYMHIQYIHTYKEQYQNITKGHKRTSILESLSKIWIEKNNNDNNPFNTNLLI